LVRVKKRRAEEASDSLQVAYIYCALCGEGLWVAQHARGEELVGGAHPARVRELGMRIIIIN